MAERIITGEPGTRWTNNTDRVRYQFIACLVDTCGACLQYHLLIGPWWPIQFHTGCQCTQIAIGQGATAPNPFVDFRELLERMPRDQQAKAIGGANYKLLKAGVVSWSEVVSKYRVSPLLEVIALHKISLETMLKSGVRPGVATRAYAAVHTPEADAIRAQRARLIDAVKGAGLSQEAMVDALSRGLVSRTKL